MNWDRLEKEFDSLNMKDNILTQGESVIKTLKNEIKNASEASELISKCERVLLTGAGDKYLIPMISEYLWQYFTHKPIRVIHSRILADYGIKEGRGTCVIFISQSGKTGDTIDAVKRVVPEGIKAIGITNLRERSSGTLYQIEDHGGIVLKTHTILYPEKPTPSTATFHSTLALLNVLLLYALHREGKGVEELIEKQTREIPVLIDELSRSRNVIKWGIEKAGGFLEFSGSSFYVVGDGPRYPIARKQALIMLMEACKQDACAVEAEEFPHSLIETLEPENRNKKPLILLKPREDFISKPISKQLEFIERVWKKYGGENRFLDVDPFNFTDYEISGYAGNLLTPPLYIIPLEWFTYYYAIAQEIDPGKTKLVGKIRGGGQREIKQKI
ncbi:MAG: SIS domain-containing protein [Candidatus Hodarchaeota archaeon]